MESQPKKGPTTVDVMASEIENLHILLVEKQTLHKKTKREAEEIMNEMKLLVDILRDKKLEEGSCKLNYLMSDVVQMAREAQENMKDGFIENSTTIIKNLKETNQKLHELGESQDRHGAGGEDGDGDMFGFDEDAKLLLDRINSYREKEKEQQEPYVGCIRGIAGSGKTTLVRHLYTHTDIVQNFDHRIWVDCTDIISFKEFLINLLRKLPGSDAVGDEEMEIADLQICVVQRLQGKQFFIVLDDVRRFWSTEKFIKYFSTHAKGRCILLFTCRNMDIVWIRWYEHDMKPLDVDTSWQLLLKTVLLSNNKLPKKVERKGKAMLMKHTGGLPLAVEEVAMEWVEKRRLGIEWEDVVESEDLKLRETLIELDLSVYQNLGPAVKSCFEHLSFFKLGNTIREQRFWGTLIESGLLDEPFDQYWVFRKMMSEQIIETFEGFDSKNISVSPIFHKLSIAIGKKAGADGALRRIINCSREKFNCSTDRNKHIKCLCFNGGGCFSAITPSYWKSFEQLRVLDFGDFGFRFLPETVGELIELRYLGLRNNYLQELPRSLGYLKRLEVLDIAHNFMVEVPDIIWEMDALVHLYMSDIFCRKPLKIEALKNLETLTYISVDNWAYEVSGLQMMTELSKLGIERLDGNLDLSKFFLSLAVLENLTCLVLRGFRFNSMPSLEGLHVLYRLRKLKLDGFITKLPCPKDFPRNIFSLTLVNSNLDDDPMLVLEELRGLEYLKLKNAYSGQQMVISGDRFLNLQSLYIKELWHLRNIKVGGGALRRLWKVEITTCPYLESLPKELLNSNVLKTKDCILTRNLETMVRKSALASILQP